MTGIMLGFIFIGIMIILIFMGVPISFALGITGVIGLFFLIGPTGARMQIMLVAWDNTTKFTMVAFPLFILMGQLVFQLGIANDLYVTVTRWFGHLPGGLAIASVFGCAGFGAVTGSSMASVAAMGTIVMPQLKKYHLKAQMSSQGFLYSV